MEKRQMLDNILLVQEVIHSSKERGDKGTIIKLDMANAFDRVRHNSLFVVLIRFGFGGRFPGTDLFLHQWALDLPNNQWSTNIFLQAL
jgi:hypothetical protein